MPDYRFMGAGETREGPHIVYRETRSGVSGNCREYPHPDFNVITIYIFIVHHSLAEGMNRPFTSLDGLNCLESGGTFELDSNRTSFAA